MNLQQKTVLASRHWLVLGASVTAGCLLVPLPAIAASPGGTASDNSFLNGLLNGWWLPVGVPLGILAVVGLVTSLGTGTPALYRRAVKLAKSQNAALIPLRLCSRGMNLLRSKLYDDALDRFDQAIALEPNLPQAWFGRGLTLAALGQTDTAIEHFDQAIQINTTQPLPDVPQDSIDDTLLMGRHLTIAAWMQKGQGWLQLDKPQQALKSFQQASRLNPRLTETWVGQGEANLALRRASDAIAAFEQALKIDATLAEAWVGQGNAWIQLKEFEEALPRFLRAINLRPLPIAALVGQGEAYLGLDRPRRALQSFEEAIRPLA